jgi:hypothetical protein
MLAQIHEQRLPRLPPATGPKQTLGLLLITNTLAQTHAPASASHV